MEKVTKKKKFMVAHEDLPALKQKNDLDILTGKANETYYLSKRNIDLIKRKTYWERHKSKGDIIDKLLDEYFKDTYFDPIPAE